jgi:hypothetical protein
MYGSKERASASPEEFLDRLEGARRTDIERLHERVRSVAPEMTVSAQAGMLAYGSYQYRYASGREGTWFVLGIASNKQYISVYAPTLSLEPFAERLPRANLGRGCIRFKRVDDVDLAVIDELIAASAANDGRRIVS